MDIDRKCVWSERFAYRQTQRVQLLVGCSQLALLIDFENGIGGFYAVQVLPFMDEYNIESYARFESEVYKVLGSQSKL